MVPLHELEAVLQRHFGFPRFRPGQAGLVRAPLAGRDALGILPTGGGKSICYQVPAHFLEGLVLVVSPLISLMQDQVTRATSVGLRAGYLAATLGPGERRVVERRMRANALDILFVSPERLESEHFKSILDEIHVALLAVDEAHCIVSWGHDFRPSYRRLGRLRAAVGAPCLALTATATPPVQEEIIRSLGLREPVRTVGGFDRPNLGWALARVSGPRERQARMKRVLARRRGPALVYASTRRETEAAGRALAGLGWPVGVYHAGRPADERQRIQDRFMSGDLRVVAATNAFGMGVDKADVRTVLHLGLPTSLEDFYQEAGRAGRDGAESWSLVLSCPGDRHQQKRFVRSSAPGRRELIALLSSLRDQGEHHAGGWVPVDAVRPPTPARLLPRVHRAPASPDPEAALGVLVGLGALETGISGGSGGLSTPGPAVRLTGASPDWSNLAMRRRELSRRLGAVRKYESSRRCRRSVLLRYFGESPPPRCGACDRCVAPVPDGGLLPADGRS
jgi:ATP-dependent DNA helicase RecQ